MKYNIYIVIIIIIVIVIIYYLYKERFYNITSNISTVNMLNYYTFDSIDNANIKNIANNNIDLYNYNGQIVSDKKVGTNSIYFNGEDQFAIIDKNALNFTTNGLTIACWFKFSGSDWDPLFDFGDNTYKDNILYAPGTDNGICVYQNGSASSANIGRYNDNNWHHFTWTMTYSPESTKKSTWKIYIDGTLKNTFNDMYYPKIIKRTSNLLGKSNGYNNRSYSRCNIDDFRIYNGILSGDEVTSLKNTSINSEVSLVSLEPQLSSTQTFIQATPVNFSNGSKTLHLNLDPIRNGLYIASESSGSNNKNATNLFNDTINDYWSSGIVSNNIVNNYTRKAYNGQSPSIYQGGNPDDIFETTVGNNKISGEWVQIQLPYKLNLKSYTFYSNNWSLGCINDFTLIGSNNGITWNIVDENSFNNILPTNQFKTFNISSSSYYSHFRLIVKSVYTNQIYARINKLYLLGIYDTNNITNYSLPPINSSGLVNYYTFDSIDNAKIKNIATNNYDLYNYDGQTVTDNKVGTNSIYFNGVDQFSMIEQNALNFTTNGLTIACWFRFYGSDWDCLFDFGDNTDKDNILYAPGVDNGIRVCQNSNVTTANISRYNDNKWYHFIWTMTYAEESKKTSIWKIYIDGNLKNTSNNMYYPKIIKRTSNLLGKSNGYNKRSYSRCNIDDFRIYNRILSDEEVITLVNYK